MGDYTDGQSRYEVINEEVIALNGTVTALDGTVTVLDGAVTVLDGAVTAHIAAYGQHAGTVNAGTLGSSWTPDIEDGDFFIATVGEDVSISVPSNITGGQGFIMELTNGGSHLITWAAGYKWASDTPPELTAAGIDILSFGYDGTFVHGCLSISDSQ